MAKRKRKKSSGRRTFTPEFKQDAVQMLGDGYSTKSVAERLGVSVNLLYNWKAQLVKDAGPVTETLDGRVRELEEELRRVERERDILKKALAIFGRAQT